MLLFINQLDIILFDNVLYSPYILVRDKANSGIIFWDAPSQWDITLWNMEVQYSNQN